VVVRGNSLTNSEKYKDAMAMQTGQNTQTKTTEVICPPSVNNKATTVKYLIKILLYWNEVEVFHNI